MKLLFVYNAHSGRQAKILDGIHKVVSPSTYACELCSLTHGSFSERKAWKLFREASALDMEFIYKDQFARLFPELASATAELPVIFKVDKEKMELLYAATDIRAFTGVESLIEALNQRVAKH